VSRLVRALDDAPFSYGPVGETRGALPRGWAHDDQVAALGTGDAVWESAKVALRRWRQFDLGWVRPHDDAVALEAGRLFGFVSRQLGVWAVNVCRVVYVIDEPNRFGFAYGTVGNHVVRGEELFLLERDLAGVVSFRIRKFSRAAHWLVHIAGPATRRIQRSFTRQAIARMKQEVSP